MTVEQIFYFGLAALVWGLLAPNQWRARGLFVASLVAVFVLQPNSALRWIFPLLSILIVLLTWAVISNKQPLVVRKRLSLLMIVLMVAILVVMKTPALLEFLSLGYQIQIDEAWVSATTLQWLGISYITFRLIAVLIEFRNDRLPQDLTAIALVTYALFPASLPAGPIDRVGRFAQDLQATHPVDAERVTRGARRIVTGLFKKFVIADTIGLVSLSSGIATDVDSTFWAWMVAYVYAFQIFFDFSGYTDIAIGLGIWVGIDLPENFNRPYLRQNLSQFWQNWHMTLTAWFRTYVFVPFSRTLLRRKLPISDYFVAQLTTMTLIGLWHGVTLNFLLWGLWHAVGLTIHRIWADRTRRWYLRAKKRPWLNRGIYVSGVLLTFHFVVIGWVFFALPDTQLSLDFLSMMFGLA